MITIVQTVSLLCRSTHLSSHVMLAIVSKRETLQATIYILLVVRSTYPQKHHTSITILVIGV